ncbi:hypothetical protein [Synechococcus sp. A15-24]|uniref:hypothetical protein n=1 Tax=Synechococcus sp. A15-24 TaxID=1050635 RepID=UPI001644C168|nr:hypothetical protein [Synechococcus sp. A15-24]QNJ29725.1 hypothetical protein SynA1524_02037 [Synechococcus sp. A15-24]
MLRLVWLLPLALLQACAGSPVAEELQRSFESPELAATEAEAPIPEQPPVVDPAPIDRSQVVDEEAATKPDTDTDTDTEVDGIDVQQPMSKSLQPPAPYRITIRLAGADPAAPAEAVTRALRKSEVVFSVERIERITP